MQQIFDHHIVRNSQICNLKKLTSKELYLILVDENTVKLTAQDYFENLFETYQFYWKKKLFFFLIRNATLDTKARMFQYAVLHNILYANKMIFKFGKVTSLRCSFFGFWDLDTNEHLILNHLLLIFKMYMYNTRTTDYLNISHLLIYIKGFRDTEKRLCENNTKRRKKFNKK